MMKPVLLENARQFMQRHHRKNNPFAMKDLSFDRKDDAFQALLDKIMLDVQSLKNAQRQHDE